MITAGMAIAIPALVVPGNCVAGSDVSVCKLHKSTAKGGENLCQDGLREPGWSW